MILAADGGTLKAQKAYSWGAGAGRQHQEGGRIAGPWDSVSLFKAMPATSVTPDFIVVDGTEGGTATAPLELASHVGMPPIGGLSFAHNAIVGAGLRDRIRLGAFGRIFSGFNKAWQIATAESFQHAPPAS